MTRRRFTLWTLSVALIGVGMTSHASAQSWAPAQLLNDPWEAGQDVKTARIVAARNGGGFHAIYHASQIRYRRYLDGVLKPSQGIHVFGFYANANLCETPDGLLHVAYEDWAGDGPEVRWYRYGVSDITGQLHGGVTQILSDSGDRAKHPQIAPFGDDGDVVMSYFRSNAPVANKHLYFSRFDGASWSAEAQMGSRGNSEYEVFGIGRSPVDGTVYRTFTEEGVLKMRRYTGYWWEPEIVLDTVLRNNDDMHNRQRLAINDAGQIMVLWDQGNRYYSVIYTPGVGVGSLVPVTSSGSWGDSLCAIPGTNTFYTSYPRDDANHVVGRRWANGAWQAEEEVSVGLEWAFSVGPDVSAAADGTLYAAWEYWKSGKPQQYYSIKPASSPGALGTIAGVVRDQHGNATPRVGINTSGAAAGFTGPDGSFSLAAPPGTYTVSSVTDRYAGQSIANIVVSQNHTTQVNLTVIGDAPDAVPSFTVTPGSTTNTLQWTNPDNLHYSATRIMMRGDAPPTDENDGEVLLEDAAAPGSKRTFTHTGLTNGQPYYYAAFAWFEGGGRFYADGIVRSATPAVQSDFDRDSDVDQVDFGLLQKCLSGSFVPQTDPLCAETRLDADPDVDQDDVGRLLNCWSGANTPAEPTCAD